MYTESSWYQGDSVLVYVACRLPNPTYTKNVVSYCTSVCKCIFIWRVCEEGVVRTL